MGLFAVLLGGDAIDTILEGLGVGNPTTQGLGLLLLDAMAISAAGWGLFQLLRKSGLDRGWSVLRGFLMAIVSSVEDATIFVSFTGVSASVLIHATSNEYSL